MKSTLILAAVMATASAANTEVGAAPVAGELGSVMTPTFLTGLISIFFLYYMFMFGAGQLMDIQTPPYQL